MRHRNLSTEIGAVVRIISTWAPRDVMKFTRANLQGAHPSPRRTTRKLAAWQRRGLGWNRLELQLSMRSYAPQFALRELRNYEKLFQIT